MPLASQAVRRTAPTETVRTGPPPIRAAWLATVPVIALMAHSNAAAPLYPLWQDRFGFSSATVTLVYVAYIVSLLVTLAVAGTASDRLGRRAVLLPALAVALASDVVFATAGGVGALVAARLLAGIATGVAVSAGMAAVVDAAGAERRRFGGLLAAAAMPLGAGLGPLLAGVLSETAPAPTITVFAVVAAALLIALPIVLRMPAPAHQRHHGGSWIRLPSVPKGNRRHLAHALATYAPAFTTTGFVLALGPSLLSGFLHTGNRAVAGGLTALLFLAATTISFAGHHMPARTARLSGVGAAVLALVALVLAVRLGSVALLAAAVVLAGAGQGLGQLYGVTLLNQHVPAERRAEVAGAFNAGAYLPSGVLPVAVGYLSDAVGLGTGATVFGVVMIAVALAGGTYALVNRDDR